MRPCYPIDDPRKVSPFIYDKLLILWEKQRKAYFLCKKAAKKFEEDRCSIHANAIAYAVVISIIPLLTIFVQLAKVNRSVVHSAIASFLAVYGLSDSTELLVILDDILSRAETIAGVGFVFVLYSATNFFRNLEDACNHIYNVPKKRPLLYRFALYISAFVLLPLVIIFSRQGLQSIRYYFETPEARQILLREGEEWLFSSNGDIHIYAQNKKKAAIYLKKKAPPQAPYRELLINTENRNSGHPWEVRKGPNDSYKVKPPERYTIIGAAQNKDTVYVVSEGATLFYSKDEGQTWQYQQILLHSNNNSYIPRVKDLHMNGRGELLLLADETTRSAILIREGERAWHYHPLDAVYKRFMRIDNISSPREGSFQNGLYLCGKGNYLYSSDQAKNWQGPFEEKYGDRKVQITAMRADRRGTMYFAGRHGAFWIRSASGLFYPDLRARFDQHVEDFVLYEDGSIFLYGSGGLFRYSEDWGRNWHLSKQEIFRQSDLLSHKKAWGLKTKKKELYFTGRENTLILTKGTRLTKESDSSGRAFVLLDYGILSRTSFWQPLLFRILLEPFYILLLFLALSLLYILLPNTKVDHRSACIGGALSSVGIALFLLLFRTSISNFTTTGYIYGVWAAIPLGMLVILVSSYIVLFGLELSFAIQKDREGHASLKISQP